MDSVIFQAIAVELNKSLANSRLDKVVQPTAGSLLLKIWTGEEKVQLLLKAEGQAAFYLSNDKYTAPAKPPRICQLLRARLRRLIEVRSEPLDRIVHFIFHGPDMARYDLVLEAFGSQGNLILVDGQGKIVDLLFRREGQRKMLPGELYQLPEQTERISLFDDISEASLVMQRAEEQGDLSFSKIAPMSPALAFSIGQARHSGQSYEAILTRIKDSFTAGTFQPQKIKWDSQAGFLPISLVNLDNDIEYFETLSMMVEQSLLEQAEETSRDLAARMSSVISKQRKRLSKRLERIAEESQRQSDPDQFKITGDLLLANLHKFKRGNETVQVDDYYQSPPELITIELDPMLKPQENAERYFKLYRKAKRAGDHHARRLQETADEIEWLDQVELSLEEAETGDDLYQVQLELEGAGMLSNTKGQLGKRKPPRPEDQLYQSTSPGGWLLYWGKNSHTNDYVSRTMTASQDYWFHAKGMPGSHLVLKCGDSAEKVAEEDILFAASLAAGYSKGKGAGKVEVIVAKGLDVKKPKGARPGLVTVDSYHSVVVKPIRLDD